MLRAWVYLLLELRVSKRMLTLAPFLELEELRRLSLDLLLRAVVFLVDLRSCLSFLRFISPCSTEYDEDLELARG